MSAAEFVKQEFRRRDEKLAALSAATVASMTGRVLSVDSVAQTATVRIGDETTGQFVDAADLPISGSYLPDVGHEVPIWLVGNVPTIMPPTNAVRARDAGPVTARGGDNVVNGGEFTAPNRVKNPSFTYDTNTWAGTNATVARITSPVDTAPGAASVTQTGTPTQIRNPASIASMALIDPSRRYQIQARIRTAVTARAVTLFIEWYDAAGAFISNASSGSLGNDSAAYATFRFFASAPDNAAYAAVVIEWASVGAGEVHYVDEISIAEAVLGWDFTQTAQAYTFDTGTESWTGDNATLALDTAFDPPALAGAGKLKLTAGTLPVQLLGAQEQNLDAAGIGLWTAVVGTTLARVTTPTHAGAGALRSTASGAGDVTAYAGYLGLAHAGQTLTASLWMRAATVSRTHKVGIAWIDATGAVIRTDYSALVASSTSAYTQISVTATAPDGTNTARVYWFITGSVLNDQQYADDISLTTTAFGAHSPTGTSGIATTPGYRVSAAVFARAAATPRTVSVSLRFYDSGGGLLSASGRAQFVTTIDDWDSATVVATAPGSAAFYAIYATTDAGVSGEVMYFDTSFGTKPTNVIVTSNTDATYVRTGATSMRLQALNNGPVNVYAPHGTGDAATVLYAIPVTPGDSWTVRFYSKNDAANATKRGMLAVAGWYDSAGVFIGTTIGTFPFTAAGTNWNLSAERFDVPTNAAYMRVQLAALCNAGDVLYVDDVEVRQTSSVEAALIPMGRIANVEMKMHQPGLIVTSLFVGAGVWYTAPSVAVANPGKPIQIRVDHWAEYVSKVVGFGNGRIGISFDNGLTWTYGPQTSVYMANAANATYASVATHMVTGTPTDTILYRAEYLAQFSNQFDVDTAAYGIHILPAPAAGSA